MHPYEIPPHVISRLMERRGGLFGFGEIEAHRTALVVIDMQNAFCSAEMNLHVPAALSIVDNINALADAARASGATVVWVQMSVQSVQDWAVHLNHLVAPKHALRMQQELQPGTHAHDLASQLRVDRERDLIVQKRRFSAFLENSSNLASQLKRLSIDTVLIAGTLTNVCSESSARDAAMQDFKVVMVSDANAARSDSDHAAALNNFIQFFGDVRTTAEAVALLAQSQE